MFKSDCKSDYKFLSILYCYNFLHYLYILIIVFIKICFTLRGTIVYYPVLVGSRHNSDDIRTYEITYNILTDKNTYISITCSSLRASSLVKSSLEHMFDYIVIYSLLHF